MHAMELASRMGYAYECNHEKQKRIEARRDRESDAARNHVENAETVIQ